MSTHLHIIATLAVRNIRRHFGRRLWHAHETADFDVVELARPDPSPDGLGMTSKPFRNLLDGQ